MTNMQPAIDYFGTQAALAKAIGVNPMSVTQWKRRGLPPRRAKEISELTHGTIKASDLLPNFFHSQQ
ncbi:MAG: Cro/CI family transcriptional regulator [Candidatus Moranbacteria bacterium]|nr:Cro/CI family transcriptional regulator [Candidatus Moranbacteria bacterium]